MRKLALLLLSVATAGAVAQHPWPMERQDRWGTGRQLSGPDPSSVTTPWLFKNLNQSGLVSHGPALDENGIGYVGDWLDFKLGKFDTASGGMLGTFDAIDRVHSAPAIGIDGEVYIATNHGYQPLGRLFRIDPNFMDYDWSFATQNQWVTDWDACSPTVGPDGDVVVGSSSGNAWRMDRQTGTPVWTVSGLGPVAHTIVFTRDDAKVVVSNHTKTQVFDYATGAPGWVFNPGSVMGQPGVAPDGTIVVGAESGLIYALNPADGSIKWSFASLAKVAAAPAFSLDGSIAYVCGYDRRLYAFRMSDGVRLWSYSAADECREPPTVGFDGRIYFGTRLGLLYCIAPNGSLVWMHNIGGEIRGGISIDQENTLYVPNRILRIIRQQATSYAITNLVVERGSLVSGVVGDLSQSDDAAVRLSGPATPSSLLPIMQVVLSTDTLFAKPTKFSFKLESRSTTTNLLQVTELFNYAMNRWDQVDSRPTTLSDNPIRIDVAAGAENYQNSGGQLKVRVLYRLTGPTPGLNIFVWLDHARYTDVVPRFEI